MRQSTTTAPYARGNHASRQAAEGIQHKLEGIRADVFNYIAAMSRVGATGSEIARALKILPYTAKPRCTELKDAGYVCDSGQLRKNENNRNETVWVAVKDHPQGGWRASKRKISGVEFSGGLQAFDHVLALRPDIAEAFGHVAIELIRHDLQGV